MLFIKYIFSYFDNFSRGNNSRNKQKKILNELKLYMRVNMLQKNIYVYIYLVHSNVEWSVKQQQKYQSKKKYCGKFLVELSR